MENDGTSIKRKEIMMNLYIYLSLSYIYTFGLHMERVLTRDISFCPLPKKRERENQ